MLRDSIGSGVSVGLRRSLIHDEKLTDMFSSKPELSKSMQCCGEKVGDMSQLQTRMQRRNI